MKKMNRFILFPFIFTLILAISPLDAYAVTDESLSVSGKAAVLMEQETGRVLFEKDAHKPMRIASITKIMTAILAIESGKMDEYVRVSEKAAWTEGSSIYLKPGEKIKLEDLVYGLMLRSGNDAAAAIAEFVGGSEEGFAFLMNQKAAEIGMYNTVFANPHGLDNEENHYSTAYDMALLTRYAMHNAAYKKISGTKVHRAPNPSEDWDRVWRNKNRLLSKYQYCTGGKTGYTKRAKRTLVSTAEKGDMSLIAVTLDDPDDWDDHITMFESGFKSFDMAEVIPKGRLKLKEEPYRNGYLYMAKDVFYPAAENEIGKFEVKYKLLPPKAGKFPGKPNKSSGIAGKAIIYLDGRAVRTVAVHFKAQKEIEKTGFINGFMHMFTLAVGMKDNG